jgi:hypothetical protein
MQASVISMRSQAGRELATVEPVKVLPGKLHSGLAVNLPETLSELLSRELLACQTAALQCILALTDIAADKLGPLFPANLSNFLELGTKRLRIGGAFLATLFGAQLLNDLRHVLATGLLDELTQILAFSLRQLWLLPLALELPARLELIAPSLWALLAPGLRPWCLLLLRTAGLWLTSRALLLALLAFLCLFLTKLFEPLSHLLTRQMARLAG